MKKNTLYLLFIALISTSSTHREALFPNVGDTAPEIILNSPAGKSIKLSELKGKVVLIDFWASWCRTCRLENQGLTKAYVKYKDKNFKNGQGFEIFSVSLDDNLELWKKAIENDGLVWKYHGCDFLKWNSKVVSDYNFSYLPHNLLIDKDGKVIAKSIFGANLENELKSRLAL